MREDIRRSKDGYVIDDEDRKTILSQAYYVLKTLEEGRKDRVVDTADLSAIWSLLWRNNMINRMNDKVAVTNEGKEFLRNYAEVYDSDLVDFDESSSALSIPDQLDMNNLSAINVSSVATYKKPIDYGGHSGVHNPRED
jgi:hypothetical protein